MYMCINMHTYINITTQVSLGIPGEVQKINAALAVALSNAWIATAGRPGANISEITSMVKGVCVYVYDYT
jgi:hypothetical protein